MAEPLRREPFIEAPITESRLAARRRSAAYQAYLLLYAAFIAAPIIAGVDKYVHALVNWDQYLAPIVTRILPIAAHPFMLIVGGIEIVAGLIVAWKPSVGAYIVTAWLWGIIVNLLLVPGYYDIALRDFGLSLGALALGRLAQQFERGAREGAPSHVW